MALTDKQFEALKSQLQKKKEQMGEEKYQQFLAKSATATQPETQTNAPFLQQVGTGSAKELVSTAIGIGSIGRSLQKGVSKGVDALFGTKNFGLGKEGVLDKGSQAQQTAQEFLKPNTGAEKLGAFATEAATFAVPGGAVSKATKGTNFLTRAGSVVASDVGAGAVQQGGLDKDSIDTAIISAIFPVAGKGAQLARNAIPSGSDSGARVINSLIKPLLKDFSYGKNPGKAVAEAGITANTLDELANNIRTVREGVGQEISNVVAQSDAVFDAKDSLSAIDDAIANARKAPKTNAAIINRLEAVKSDLLKADELGVPTRNLDQLTANELWEFNKEIGELARWTGNASDDEIVNKAVRNAYANTRSKLESQIPELAETSEKYANLKSAEIATEYRDKLAARQGMVSFSGTQIGTGGALAGALLSGGAAIPTILLGAGSAAANEAFKSPAVKTRLATWLASASKAEKEKAFKDIPWLRSSIQAALFDEENLDDEEN